MSQVFEYLEAYSYYYEFTFKWPLKIGRIYKNYCTFGHIIVGLTKKICDYIDKFDLTELKWMVFDECDKIKDDENDNFKKILGLFSKNKLPANAYHQFNIVFDYISNRLKSELQELHPRQLDKS